jgi:hypothetical protein
MTGIELAIQLGKPIAAEASARVKFRYALDE